MLPWNRTRAKQMPGQIGLLRPTRALKASRRPSTYSSGAPVIRAVILPLAYCACSCRSASWGRTRPRWLYAQVNRSTWCLSLLRGSHNLDPLLPGSGSLSDYVKRLPPRTPHPMTNSKAKRALSDYALAYVAAWYATGLYPPTVNSLRGWPTYAPVRHKRGLVIAHPPMPLVRITPTWPSWPHGNKN